MMRQELRMKKCSTSLQFVFFLPHPIQTLRVLPMSQCSSPILWSFSPWCRSPTTNLRGHVDGWQLPLRPAALSIGTHGTRALDTPQSRLETQMRTLGTRCSNPQAICIHLRVHVGHQFPCSGASVQQVQVVGLAAAPARCDQPAKPVGASHRLPHQD